MHDSPKRPIIIAIMGHCNGCNRQIPYAPMTRYKGGNYCLCCQADFDPVISQRRAMEFARRDRPGKVPGYWPSNAWRGPKPRDGHGQGGG